MTAIETTLKPATMTVTGYAGLLDALQDAIARETLRRDLMTVLAATPKFGCLMAMCPTLDATLPNWAADRILPSELANDGIEQEPHITVLYGFNLSFDASQLRPFLKRPTVRLGKVTRFECPEYDVLKVDIESPDLERLHSMLALKFADDITPSKWDYHPHLTLAYVQKGACQRLDGSTDFEGRDIHVSQMLYSLPEKQGRKVFDVVKASQAPTERERMDAHEAAREAAKVEHKKAALKALAAAEAAVLAGKTKNRKGREEAEDDMLLFLLLGGIAGYLAARRVLAVNTPPTAPRATTSPSARPSAPASAPGSRNVLRGTFPPPALDHEAEAIARRRQPVLQPVVSDTIDELEQELEAAKAEAPATKPVLPTVVIAPKPPRSRTSEESELSKRLSRKAAELEDSRWERVADTEAQASYGSAAIQQLADGGFVTKKWVTMEDERVRPTHVACGNQKDIPLDQPFANGLMYPGEPDAPASEVINCRCQLVGGRRKTET